MFYKLPSTTYIPTGAVLVVPKEALLLMGQGLAPYREARLEGCCFLYGPRGGSNEVSISYLVFPKQVNNPKNYTVSSEAIAEMSAATRPLEIVNRMQIHTHPGRWVDHSPYDDEHAISRKAVSVVLPYYGATIDAWPKGIGVHEFQTEKWHLLSKQHAEQRIRLVEGGLDIIDLR